MADPSQTKNYTPVSAPPASASNIQATRHYIFNETGNIMVASTADGSQPISQAVQDVFAEVSVFFAAMTKAVTTTKNPNDKTGGYYSLYDYEALNNVISGSGLFVHVTEEDLSYTSQKVGVDFSKDLLEALLGLATGTGALAFASAMVSSMGSAGLKINENSSGTDKKVGNVIFVCEYLLGMPVISALVFYLDISENQEALTLGPCFKESHTSTNLKMHKDTYMFVTPKFIKEYSGDLDSVFTTSSYSDLVNELSALVAQSPIINQVTDSAGTAVTELEQGQNYVLTGQYLGDDKTTATISLKGTNLAATDIQLWTSSQIKFTANFGSTAITTATDLSINYPNNKLITSPSPFTYQVSGGKVTPG